MDATTRSHVMFALVEEDDLVHLFLSDEQDPRWALHRYSDKETVCDLYTTAVASFEEHGPVQLSKFCFDCLFYAQENLPDLTVTFS